MADDTPNDGLLYTGLTSRSSMRQQEKRRKRIEESNQERAELVPKADLIINEILKERVNIANELGNLINLDMSAQAVKATILGLRIADQRLIVLSNRMKTILRKPLPKLDDGLEEDDE